eukprot:366466-Chlamydomonas_euryale.AAC.8
MPKTSVTTFMLLQAHSRFYLRKQPWLKREKLRVDGEKLGVDGEKLGVDARRSGGGIGKERERDAVRTGSGHERIAWHFSAVTAASCSYT